MIYNASYKLKKLYNGRIDNKMNIMYLKFGVMIVKNILLLLLCECNINNTQKRKNAENMMRFATTHFMQFSTKSIKLVLYLFFLTII